MSSYLKATINTAIIGSGIYHSRSLRMWRVLADGELSMSDEGVVQVGEIWKTFCSKLRGHVQYYGVSFNFKMVAKFLNEARKIIFKWLNRRSQRKSFDWNKFSRFVTKNPLPRAKIVHRLF